MGILTEEEKARIIEEEEVRSRVRRKYEQKSSGMAAVLSTLCPGLGQVYNGQIGKGATFFLVFIIGISVLSMGAIALVKGPSSSTSFNVAGGLVGSEEPVVMNEEGMVLEEMAAESALQKQGAAEVPAAGEGVSKEQKAVIRALLMTLFGAIITIIGVFLAIGDAIRTARRMNQEVKL